MKIRFTAAIIGVLSFAFLTVGLTNPLTYIFDEACYVGSARSFLNHAPNVNPEHPPLAKYLIASGIKVFGDNARGWRTPSAVAGALVLVAIFLLVYLLLNEYKLAIFATLLTFVNGFQYVMARVAMLDVFLLMFTVWAVVAFGAAVQLEISPSRRRSLVVVSGILFGLATACKWNAIVSLAVIIVICSSICLLPKRGLSSEKLSKNVGEIGIPTLAASFVILPVVVYALAFWPLCRSLGHPFSIAEIKTMNLFIWNFHRAAGGNLALTSPWYSWVLRITPERNLSYLMGNLIVMGAGLIAVMLLLSRVRELKFAEWTVLLLYLANLLQWAITPRPFMYYYYYFPAATFLSVVLAVALNRAPRSIAGVRVNLIVLFAAGAFFLYCLPQMAHLGSPWDTAFGQWSLH